MGIQKTKYISDTPDVELAAMIKKFCDLVEMQPPSQAKEFINLLRLGFGRYPFEMLENAFTMWMLKRSEVRATKICNIKWISDVLNEYIANNRHKIQLKPKRYLEIAAPEAPKVSRIKMAKDMFENIKIGKGILYPLTLAMAYDEINIEVESFEDELTYIMNIEDKQTKKLIQLMGKKKVQRHDVSRDVYVKAAKMLNLLKNGKC